MQMDPTLPRYGTNLIPHDHYVQQTSGPVSERQLLHPEPS